MRRTCELCGNKADTLRHQIVRFEGALICGLCYLLLTDCPSFGPHLIQDKAARFKRNQILDDWQRLVRTASVF